MEVITKEQAEEVGKKIGINFSKFDVEQFRRGLEVEQEHGEHDPETNVIDGNLELAGKIAWAHLKEIPDYYTRLDKMEKEAGS